MLSNDMKRRIARISGIVLFVIAGLLFVYCIWSFIYLTKTLVSNFKNNGLTYKDNAYYIFETFFMSYPVKYLVNVVTLSALAMLLSNWHRPEKAGDGIPAAVYESPEPGDEWSPFETSGDADEIADVKDGEDE